MYVEESFSSAHCHPSPPSDDSPPTSSSGTATSVMEPPPPPPPPPPRPPSPSAAKEMMNIKDSLTSPSAAASTSSSASASTTVPKKSINSSEFSVVPLAGPDGDEDFDESPLPSPFQSPIPSPFQSPRIPSPFQSPQIPSPYQSPPESPPAGKKMDDDDVLLNPFRHHSTVSNLANSSLPTVIGETSPSGMDEHLDLVAEPPPPTRPGPLEHRLPFQRPNVMLPSRDLNSMFSGGGITFLTDRQVSYGYSTFKGKRASMEDFYETSISEVDGQMVAFFGVFDGHGGSRTAEYLKNNLFKNLSSHPDFIKDTKSAIVESFKQTDADYLNEEKGQQRDAGSTASTAVLLGDHLLVANVGDSRVVACRAGTAIPLSIDHKPDRSDERQRIEEAGGFIIWAGTWRVGGVLAVSRAFGDKLLKPLVVAEPEIQEEKIDGVDFIIIASDGLWNVLSNKCAVAIIKDIVDAEAASRKLIEEAYARGSSDNITCVVVRFENP